MLLLGITISANSQTEYGETWNQFRGKNRTGISQENLNGTEATLIWKKEIGAGFSELLISDGRVYTMYSEKTDSVSGFDILAAFDEKTGEVVWKLNADSIFIEIDGWGDGPRSTPAVDDLNIYWVSLELFLQCLLLQP